MDITKKAQDIQPYLVSLRETFHRHPEASGEEKYTAQLIIEELERIGGYTITPNVGGYGVLAEIHGETAGRTLVLRSDMDALNIQEETGLSCCSENPGKMHACGHDFHMTMLLGAAKLIKENISELKGCVRLCFQPSEECTPRGGSRDMIAGGALDNADAVFGLHVWPHYPAGLFGIRTGPLMAASDHFYARFQGRASHAARPHEGIDALLAGAQFVTTAQTLISRNKNPLNDAVITMGKCSAGSAYNIVPEHCVVEGTCRTFTPEDRDMIERRLGEVIDGVCLATGCTGSLEYQRGYIALINEPTMTQYLSDTVVELFGDKKVSYPPEPSMASEDFAFYVDQVPGCFAWLTASVTENDAPLHNSKFSPDVNILWRGVALFVGLALEIIPMPIVTKEN